MAAFAESYGRWGGQRTLFVPVLNGEVTSAYWDWLHWWDPDLVYSYAQLSKTSVPQIAAQNQPMWFLAHKTLRPSHEPVRSQTAH